MIKILNFSSNVWMNVCFFDKKETLFWFLFEDYTMNKEEARAHADLKKILVALKAKFWYYADIDKNSV